MKEAEFGVDAFEEDEDDEDKPETKAHYAPSQSYYLLNNDLQKTAFSSSSNSKSSAKQRPNSNVWRPCE